MKARTASRLTRISPLNKASRLKALSALLQASIAAGAFSAAVPAVAGTKHVSDYFPGILWSNPLGWGPVGEPRGGDVIFVDKGPGIAFAPLLGIDETFEALTVNASTDTNPLLFVPLTSTVIPIPAVNDFPANVLLPAMHLRSNNVTLGETQAGALIQTGGFLTVNQDLRLGHANTGWGFYSITSPDFTSGAHVVRDAFIGAAGIGTVAMSNNVFSVDRDLSFGDLAGGVGSMHFAGELTVGRDEILGNAGTGRMIQGISLHTVGNNFTLARQAGSQASFVGLPGSRLHVGKDLVVGAAGNATMNFSGGLMNVGNDLIVAGAGGSSGTLHFDGPSFVDIARDFVVGDGGEGSGRKVLDLLSSIKVGRDLMLGRSAGGAGTFEMLAGNMIVTRDVVVGNGGRGLLVVGVASGLIVDGNVTVGRSNVTVGLPPLSLPGLPNVQLSDLIANAASNAPSPSLGTTFGTLPDIGLSPDLEYTAFRTLSDGLRVDFPFVPANTMLVFAGASVPIRGNLVVGAEGKGVFGHFAAGAVEVGGSLIVGQQGEGVYSAGGLASLVVDGDWIVGDAGKGVWAGGGTMAVHGNAVFGRQAGSRALLNYVAGGGTSLSHDLILGDHGSATLVQAASGGFLIGGSFVAGREADGVGTWDVAADQLSIGGDLVLGGKGRGTATLRQGATIAVTGAATLGQAAGSHGTLDMTGTGLGLGGSMVVGAAGEGGLHLRSGSSLLMGGALTFGELAGAVGDGTFDAGSYLSVGGALVVGAAGNGTVSFTSAAGSSEGAPFTVKSDVLLGRDQGVTGTGTLVGLSGNAPALEITGSMTVGADGQGSFTHTGGRVGIGVDLTLGASGFGAGRYEIGGDANLRIDRDLVVGNTGHAEFVHNGGDVTVAGRVTLALHGQPATYQLLGGKLLAHDFWLNSQGAFTAGLGIASFDSASVFDGTLDLGRNSDLVLQANPVAPVHRIGYLELTGGTVRAGKLSILPDGSIHQNGGELDTLQIVFDHGTVLGELQSKRLFTVVGPTPALFGGRLRNEGLIELLTDFEAADGVDNRGTFDIAAARTVKLSGSGLANRGDMELRGRLDTNETRVTGSIRQYGGSHITGELTVEDGGGAQARYSLVDGLLQVEQFSTIGASDTPGLFVQEGGTHDVGRLLRVAGGGRYTMVGGRIVAESTLNEGLFEVTNGRIDTSFENAGSFRWNGQGDVAGTGTITHLSSGSFEASATGSFAPAVVNRGQWTKEGAGTQTYSGPITQNGSLLVNAGTMRLTGGATGEGNTSIATGAAMEFAGGASYTLSRQFNNNGQVLIDPAAATFRGSGLHTGRFDVDAGGDLTFAGISWTFNGTGSGIAGTGAMTFASGLTTFGQGSAFKLTGPLHLTGGSVRFLAGSAMTLPEDFVIQGTVLELSTGSAQSYGRTVALNAGGLGGSDPFDLTAGDLDWNGGTLFGPGVLTLRGNTRLLIDGPDDKTLEREVLVQDKAQWNSGNVIGGGLLHVADTGNFSVLTGGAFQANLLAQGRFDLFAPDQVAHFSGGFDAQAEVRLRAGTLRLSGNGESTAAFNVFSGGAVEFAGGTFDFHGRDASLTGPGRALFTGGTVVFRDGASYAMGSERITSGTLDFQAGSSYALNGGLVLEGGNLLLNAGSPFVLPPSTHLQSGLLGGGDAKHVNTEIVFLWSGGTIAGGGLAVLSGGRMEMIPGGAKVLETGIANAGVIAWRGSDVAGPGSFTNLAGGVFEISGSGTLYPSLANAGRLVMDGANENASLRGAFSNTGTVEVTAGTLHVLGPFSNLAGSTLTGGRYDLRGTLHHEGQSIRTIAADVTLAGAGSYLRSGTNQSVLDTLDTVAASGRFTVSEGRDFSMSNRSLTVDGEFVVGSGSTFVAQAFNLGGSGAVRVGDGGLFVWSGASLRSPGLLQPEAGGVLRITGGNDHDMDQRRLVNDGTVVWEGGSIRGGGGSGIENNGLWLDQLAGNAEFNRAYGGANGGWVNNGTYRKTTGAITTFNQSLSNRNLIEVQAGVLRLSSSTVHETGSRIEVVDGALLELRADHTFQDGVHLDGPVKLYGGAGISGHLFATDFEIGSGSTLYGTHALHGDFRWTTGSLKSAGTTTVGGDATLTITGGNDHDMDQRRLVNDGTVVWEGGSIRGGGGSGIENNGLWLDQLAGNAEFNRAYGGANGGWVNNGTYRKTTGVITTFNQSLSNRNLIEVQAGVLRLSSSTVHETGSRIEVVDGALLELRADHTFQDGVHLDGPVKLYGGAGISGHLFATDFEIGSGSTLYGTHALHGDFRWTTGSLKSAGTTTVGGDATLTITGGNDHDMDQRRLVNDGTVVWEGGSIRGGGGSGIENNGLWLDQLAGNAEFNRAYGGANGGWVNNGTYRKTTGVITTFNHSLSNRNLIEVQAGVLRLSGNTVHETGSLIQVAAGAMLEIRSTHTFQDGVTLEGPVKVLGTANVEGNLTAMAFELAGGVLGGSHTLHGNYLWTTGTLNGAGTTVIADALFTIAGAGDHDLDRRTLVNDGTVVWEGGNIRGGSGTTVVNNGEWLDRVSGNSEFNRAYGGADGEWVNNGTYLKTGGAITTFAHTLRNRGVFEVDAGVLRLAGNTTHEAGSRMEAAAGALLEIHSTHTFEDGVTLDGAVKLLGTANVTGHLTATAFDIAGGVLGGSHTLHGSYRWSAGTLNGAGVTRVAADGVFMIAGGGNHDLDRRVLVNEGTVDWQAGAIRGGGGSRIENAGLWLDQTTGVSDIDRAYGGSGGNFVNGGTYLKSGAGTTRITGHAFDNTGVVNVQAGRLELLGGVTQIAGSMLTGGTWHVGANSAIVVAGAPIVTVNGGSVWMEGAGSSFAPIDGLADNRGTFRITGGRNFTTMGNLVNSGQIFVGAGSSLQVLGQLESDGAIGGGGRISVSNMRARGRIAPGASPGELTIQGDLALEDGAALEIEIAGLAAGTEYDVLRVTGALSLDGTLDVKLLSNFAGLASGTFAFISAESVLGTFDGIADGDRVFTADGSGSFLIDYTSDAVYLRDYTATAAVPEPGTWGLLITGLGMMAGLVRRRRR